MKPSDCAMYLVAQWARLDAAPVTPGRRSSPSSGCRSGRSGCQNRRPRTCPARASRPCRLQPAFGTRECRTQGCCPSSPSSSWSARQLGWAKAAIQMRCRVDQHVSQIPNQLANSGSSTQGRDDSNCRGREYLDTPNPCHT